LQINNSASKFELIKQNSLLNGARDEKIAYQPFYDSLITTVILVIFIFLFIFLFSNLTLKRILNPLRNFANQIIKVRKGCYDNLEFKKSSIAELNFIQNKFQEMVKLIKKREDDLTKISEELKIQNQSLIDTKAELDKQLEKGCKLHRRFLPDEEIKLIELNIESYHQPSKILGGDFFNLIENESYLIKYLADVRGHGLDGAFINISIREKINSYLYQHRDEIISPAKILNFVHSSIQSEDIPDDYFVAMLVIVYDKKEEKFVFSNAGIQFPLLIKRRQKVEEIMIKEMPISKIIPASNYDFKERTFKLKKDDYIFVTTDGLIEEKRAGNHYGWERLKKLIIENQNDFKKIILDDFKSFCEQNRAADDVTFMLIKYNLE
jgi:serine phosphatase RsbU (regulator of sigma subunit)